MTKSAASYSSSGSASSSRRASVVFPAPMSPTSTERPRMPRHRVGEPDQRLLVLGRLEVEAADRSVGEGLLGQPEVFQVAHRRGRLYKYPTLRVFAGTAGAGSAADGRVGTGRPAYGGWRGARARRPRVAPWPTAGAPGPPRRGGPARRFCDRQVLPQRLATGAGRLVREAELVAEADLARPRRGGWPARRGRRRPPAGARPASPGGGRSSSGSPPPSAAPGTPGARPRTPAPRRPAGPSPCRRCPGRSGCRRRRAARRARGPS